MAPPASLGSNPRPWLCPLCSVNDGLKYETAEVRCQFREHVGTGICIDTALTLQNGKDVVTNLQEQPAPVGHITLVVKAFEPGKPVTYKEKQNQLSIVALEKDGKARKPKKQSVPASSVRGVPNPTRGGKKPTGGSQSARPANTPVSMQQAGRVPEPFFPNVLPGHLPPASGPVRSGGEPYYAFSPSMHMVPGHMGHQPFPGPHPPFGNPPPPSRPPQDVPMISPTAPMSPAERDLSRPIPPSRQLNSFTASMVIPPFRAKMSSDAPRSQSQDGSPRPPPQGQHAILASGSQGLPSPSFNTLASSPSLAQAQSETAPPSVATAPVSDTAATAPLATAAPPPPTSDAQSPLRQTSFAQQSFGPA